MHKRKIYDIFMNHENESTTLDSEPLLAIIINVS